MMRISAIGWMVCTVGIAFTTHSGWAANAPGGTDKEIRIGQTMPYSGPASAYATIGKTEAAYFEMINSQGGVNGRKIRLISLDDGYNPAKTVEQIRNLVEQQNVALLFSTLGTAPNAAIEKYLNNKEIPQLFLLTGAYQFGNYKRFPWTIGWVVPYRLEANIYGKYIRSHKPDAKIAVLYQNDDFGKDYLIGLKDGLGAKADSMVIATQTYESTEPTVASQIVSLQGSGADTLLVAAIPKFSAQAIRKTREVGWKPTLFLANVSNSVTSVMKPAGAENSTGVISGEYAKDPTDPVWKDDPALASYIIFLKKYYPAGQIPDVLNTYGYGLAQTMVQVLKQCGSDLSRANIMKQAANLNLSLPLLLPGIQVTTSPTDYFPIKQMQLARFDGTTWVLFGEVISGASK
jgi:branched-chain amino acid transport system substrate-binding protein